LAELRLKGTPALAEEEITCTRFLRTMINGEVVYKVEYRFGGCR
jgi:hypothetical protein